MLILPSFWVVRAIIESTVRDDIWVVQGDLHLHWNGAEKTMLAGWIHNDTYMLLEGVYSTYWLRVLVGVGCRSLCSRRSRRLSI
jgi:hypothetical protein